MILLFHARFVCECGTYPVQAGSFGWLQKSRLIRGRKDIEIAIGESEAQQTMSTKDQGTEIDIRDGLLASGPSLPLTKQGSWYILFRYQICIGDCVYSFDVTLRL